MSVIHTNTVMGSDALVLIFFIDAMNIAYILIYGLLNHKNM